MSEQDAGEVLANVITRLERAETRLDKQAKAIRALRERVSALESCDQSQLVGAPARGAYMHTYKCILCGADNGGRKTLTCRECSRKRQASINGDAPRPTYEKCFNCGESKAANMNYLCAPCSASFKQWKAVN